MIIKNLICRLMNNSTDGDAKAELLKSALLGEEIYVDLVDAISDHLLTQDDVPPLLYGLTRATGELLKVLEKEGCSTKDQFEEMLNVWLNDVDDSGDPFYSMKRRFKEYRKICG